MLSTLTKREVVAHTKDDIATLIAQHLRKKRTEVLVLREAVKRAYPVTYEQEFKKIHDRVEELMALVDKEKNASS